MQKSQNQEQEQEGPFESQLENQILKNQQKNQENQEKNGPESSLLVDRISDITPELFNWSHYEQWKQQKAQKLEQQKSKLNQDKNTKNNPNYYKYQIDIQETLKNLQKEVILDYPLVTKHYVKRGQQTEQQISDESDVTILYEGRDQEGILIEKTNSFRQRDNLVRFKMIHNSILPILRLSLYEMRVGDIFYLQFPYQLYFKDAEKQNKGIKEYFYYIEVVEVKNHKKEIDTSQYSDLIQHLKTQYDIGKEHQNNQNLDLTLKYLKKGYYIIKQIPKKLKKEISKDQISEIQCIQTELYVDLSKCLLEKDKDNQSQVVDILKEIEIPSSESCYQLGLIYQNLKDLDSSLKQFQHSYILDNKNEQALKKLQEIQKIKGSQKKIRKTFFQNMLK